VGKNPGKVGFFTKKYKKLTKILVKNGKNQNKSGQSPVLKK